tara:strand:- start:610 stop:882 length:273 start_codon:yes stop_codon:yes gene_type:complete
MKIQTYRYTINDIHNGVYNFIIKGSGPTPYIINIEVDELNDNVVGRKDCTCPDHTYREKDCKHINLGLGILKEDGIDLNTIDYLKEHVKK